MSGAGISAESGIPTFRGNDGLWKNYRAEDLATPQAFHKDPNLVWEWYNWRKALVLKKNPNPAHYALIELKKKIPNLISVTQNVDGLHKRAGDHSIIELHGNLFRARCLNCPHITFAEHSITPIDLCAACNRGNLRPDIVWFGEALDKTIMHDLYDVLTRCDLILVVGTSGVVYPAAGFAVEVRRRGGVVIEINIEMPRRDYPDDILIQGRAGDILPRIAKIV